MSTICLQKSKSPPDRKYPPEGQPLQGGCFLRRKTRTARLDFPAFAVLIVPQMVRGRVWGRGIFFAAESHVFLDFRLGIEYDRERIEFYRHILKESFCMLTLESFKEARSVLHGVLRPTPLIHSPYLSKSCGNSVYLKPENMQVTGA